MDSSMISPTFRRGGFTVIELVVVIVVVAILTAILVPTVTIIIRMTDDKESMAMVQRTSRAAEAFKSEHNGRYPGQDDVGLLKGTAPEPGPYTGSQILAARLFDYPDSEINNTPAAGVSATSKYIQYRSHLLISRSSKGENIPGNSLGDNSRTPNALLYFPSRLNVSEPAECYKWDDNSDYIKKDVASTRALFNSGYIRDPKFSDGNTARNAGGMLIIGTGANDRYLESDDNDDIKSWTVD